MQIKDQVFEAFREDHAALGKMLYTLRMQLGAGEFQAARKTADTIDQQAGAHIAFEEGAFYPMLKPFLSAAEVEAMFKEHAEGLAIIRNIAGASDEEFSDPLVNASTIMRIEALEGHVSDCGELFGAMGGLTQEQYRRLMSSLTDWRKKAPRWSEIAKPAILKTGA